MAHQLEIVNGDVLGRERLAPGKAWMLFVLFCAIMLMGSGAYFNGQLTFTMVLDYIDHLIPHDH